MANIIVSQVENWAKELLQQCNQTLTCQERKEQKKYATLIRNPKNKIFLSRLLDESSQIRHSSKLAKRIKVLLCNYGIPDFFGTFDKMLLKGYQWFGYHADFIAIPIFKQRLRKETETVIIHEERPKLTKHLADRKQKNIGQNVNLLGEVVLGDGEANIRYHHYMKALEEQDINYISIKLSGIYAQLHPLNFRQSKEDLISLVSSIFQKAIDNPYLDADGIQRSKFVNLDMEEYKDAHLTLEVFIEVLSKPEFKNYMAGIVIQAYLPDAEGLLEQLLAFAKQRVTEGGSPLKVRLVKGANLQMESIISSLRGWENPIIDNKVTVDANYLRLIDKIFMPENAAALHVGIASHNLFSIGYAYLKAKEMEVSQYVTFEMLEGMANQLWRTLSNLGCQIILYTPVVKNEHFLNAVSYLVRRLDENTGVDNFLSYSFGLEPDTKEWDFLQQQFEHACKLKDQLNLKPKRQQNRNKEVHNQIFETFQNEPDTNFDLAHHHDWAENIIRKWQNKEVEIIPLQIGEQQVITEKKVRYEDRWIQGYIPYEMSVAQDENIRQMIQVSEASSWRKTTIEERIKILHAVANKIAENRGDLIGCMATVTGKTLNEGDVEVSEAIDFCRFYPLTFQDFMKETGVKISPKGTVLVISPWNFPLAIPVGGIAAALSGGNSVILKPATVAAPVMWEVCKLFWEAGIPKDALQIVITDGHQPLDILTTSPNIKHIILTGGTDTAQRIARKNPTVKFSAETGGKNVMILTGSGDRDKAIMNVVTSAFGNAGQKCSACSLLLVEKSIYEDPAFRTKLKDAALSMHTGSPWNLTNVVGPMITNKNDKLLYAIENKEEYTEWLIAPEFIDQQKYILRPTILWGVRPDSYTFRTELFAPLLSVGVIDSLRQGIYYVNNLDYGLTSGLQSLDEREISLWENNLEAGNLYINRGMTGAIVNRQPFGGMKLSAFGGGIKAGSINYVSCFVNIENDNMQQDNYEKVYVEEFQTPRDIHHLYGEQNIFRYLPLSRMGLRVFDNDSMEDICLIIKAAKITKTPLTISIAERDVKIKELSTMKCTVVIESFETFLRNIPNYERLRTCSEDVPQELYQMAALHNKYIATAKPLYNGRFELLHYLKEQSISYEYHRYGSITEIPEVQLNKK